MQLPRVVTERLVCTSPGDVEWQHTTCLNPTSPTPHRRQPRQSRWLHLPRPGGAARSHRGHQRASGGQVRHASDRDAGWLRGSDGATSSGTVRSHQGRTTPGGRGRIHRRVHDCGRGAGDDPPTPGRPDGTLGRHRHSHHRRLRHQPDHRG